MTTRPPRNGHLDTHRGISASMGAEKMSAVCLELQKAGETKNLSRAPALVGQLEEEFGRVRPALEAEAEKAGSGG